MGHSTITPTAMRDLPPLAPGAAKFRVFDSRLRGFIAEQRQTGITFYLRYKDGHGRNRELKIGRLGDLTVEQARKRAEQLKASVSMGADPLAERDKKRAVPTFGEFAAERYLPFVREHLRSAHNIDAYLRLRILPFLGRKTLDEINQDDIATLRRQLIDAKLSASSVNRHLATVRRMMNLAQRWELYEGRNPAASPGMLREVHRDKYLSGEQTQALMHALDRDKDPGAAAALALLAVTGARRNEIMLATWDNVDLDRCMLTVPRAKSGQPRHIPLSPFATAILERQARRRLPDNPHLFPSQRRPGEAVEGLRGVWARAKKAAGLACDLRIHDMRHSFASALANAGTPLNEIGTVLGHTQLSTTSRYAHFDPRRLIATATAATTAWNLLPADADHQTAD